MHKILFQISKDTRCSRKKRNHEFHTHAPMPLLYNFIGFPKPIKQNYKLKKIHLTNAATSKRESVGKIIIGTEQQDWNMPGRCALPMS